MDVPTSERFVDASPGQVVATLLDQGRYLASARTMYRVPAEHGATAERRLMRKHPLYAKPELIATAPNEVWSWDITKLRGPAKWITSPSTSCSTSSAARSSAQRCWSASRESWRRRCLSAALAKGGQAAA